MQLGNRAHAGSGRERHECDVLIVGREAFLEDLWA